MHSQNSDAFPKPLSQIVQVWKFTTIVNWRVSSCLRSPTPHTDVCVFVHFICRVNWRQLVNIAKFISKYCNTCICIIIYNTTVVLLSYVGCGDADVSVGIAWRTCMWENTWPSYFVLPTRLLFLSVQWQQQPQQCVHPRSRHCQEWLFTLRFCGGWFWLSTWLDKKGSWELAKTILHTCLQGTSSEGEGGHRVCPWDFEQPWPGSPYVPLFPVAVMCVFYPPSMQGWQPWSHEFFSP